MVASAQQYRRMIWLLPWDQGTRVRHLPWVTWTLVVLNVLVFVFAPGDDASFLRWGLVPSNAHWYQFLTSNFLHADAYHLVGNMLFLVIFGDNVEDAFGPIPFLLLYFAGGLLGDWWWVSANPAMDIPGVGASGCIATLAGAYGVMYFSKTIEVKLMFFVIPVGTFEFGAMWVLLFWFGADIVQTFYTRGVMHGPGVNFVAHGAGFVVGLTVALAAVLYGVRRRYEDLSDGDAWLGYWPTGLEERARVQARARARRSVRMKSNAIDRQPWDGH